MRVRLLAAVTVVAISTLVPRASSSQTAPVKDDVPRVAIALGLPHTDSQHPTIARSRALSSDRGAAALRAAAPLRSAAPRTPRTVAASSHKLVREYHVLYTKQGEGGHPSNATPCPRASTCDSYLLKPARWPVDASGVAVIPFAYNDEGRRPARAAEGIAQPALTAAMGEWSRWNSNVVFQNTGTTTAAFAASGKDGSCDDGTNVVTWEKFDPEVIGEAVLCFDQAGRVIRDADLALNATQHWERVSGEPESRHSHDIQTIYTHELGHWIGFEDIYSGNAARQTMYGITDYGETRKRTLALGDITGLQKAYPCGSGDRCPRSGIVDD